MCLGSSGLLVHVLLCAGASPAVPRCIHSSMASYTLISTLRMPLLVALALTFVLQRASGQGSDLLFVSTPASWSAAEADCVKRGGHLASISTATGKQATANGSRYVFRRLCGGATAVAAHPAQAKVDLASKQDIPTEESCDCAAYALHHVSRPAATKHWVHSIRLQSADTSIGMCCCYKLTRFVRWWLGGLELTPLRQH